MGRIEPKEYSTYTKIVRVSASKLGMPPTNPPAVKVYGITHVLESTGQKVQLIVINQVKKLSGNLNIYY